MLLVIFGAGASYDSAPSRSLAYSQYHHLDNRPPLASQLFGDRAFFGEVMGKYPQCRAVIPYLRHPPNNSSVEAQLQILQQEAISYPEGSQQLAAIRYYLQEMLWKTGDDWLKETHNISNYLTLLNRIKRWKSSQERVCFVTFNYDLLLDQALRDAGYPFDELSGYIARDLMLVKLHGSVNWGRIVTSDVPRDLINEGKLAVAQSLVRYYSGLQISREYVLVRDYPPTPRTNQVFFPALAIPVETKLDFECPPGHVNALKAFIPEVTKILVIGWRATEQPFLELLKTGLGAEHPHFFIVNGTKSAAESTMLNIKRFGIPGKYEIAQQNEFGFSEFILEQKVDEFLSSN